jgi:hypothetical protein
MHSAGASVYAIRIYSDLATERRDGAIACRRCQDASYSTLILYGDIVSVRHEYPLSTHPTPETNGLQLHISRAQERLSSRFVVCSVCMAQSYIINTGAPEAPQRVRSQAHNQAPEHRSGALRFAYKSDSITPQAFRIQRAFGAQINRAL